MWTEFDLHSLPHFTWQDYTPGIPISYAIYPTCLGEVFLATTDLGICALSFGKSPWAPHVHLFARKFGTSPMHDKTKVAPWWKKIRSQDTSLPLVLHGTHFQKRVWKALATIPPGQLLSYSALTKNMGMPQSTRAVAHAIAQNSIACLIPCHRIIRKDGSLGGYRWGLPLKEQLLQKEKKECPFLLQERPTSARKEYAALP